MRRGIPFLFLAAALAACGGNDYKLDDVDDPPPVLTLDECATTGDQYIADLAALGCTVTWGVDIAADVAGHVNAVGFGMGILADGEWDGGGSCDLNIECPVTPCLSEFIVCVQDYGDIPFCMEENAECDTREFCQADKDDCDVAAENLFNACIDVETFDYCNDLRSDALLECYCIYDACIHDGEWDPGCLEALGMPPAPIPLEPRVWSLTRSLIDQQMARLDTLEVETPLWPVHSLTAAAWRGARLAHVHPDSTLYALGLRSGDILRTANGIKVIDAMAQPGLLLPLRNANQIRLVLERSGATREHLYKIKP